MHICVQVYANLFLLLWQGVSDENSKMLPWTQIAKYKLMVEEELAKLEGYEIINIEKLVLSTYCLIANLFFFPD